MWRLWFLPPWLTHTDTQTDSFWPVILLAQPAELKSVNIGLHSYRGKCTLPRALLRTVQTIIRRWRYTKLLIGFVQISGVAENKWEVGTPHPFPSPRLPFPPTTWPPLVSDSKPTSRPYKTLTYVLSLRAVELIHRPFVFSPFRSVLCCCLRFLQAAPVSTCTCTYLYLYLPAPLYLSPLSAFLSIL